MVIFPVSRLHVCTDIAYVFDCATAATAAKREYENRPEKKKTIDV